MIQRIYNSLIIINHIVMCYIAFYNKQFSRLLGVSAKGIYIDKPEMYCFHTGHRLKYFDFLSGELKQ